MSPRRRRKITEPAPAGRDSAARSASAPNGRGPGESAHPEAKAEGAAQCQDCGRTFPKGARALLTHVAGVHGLEPYVKKYGHPLGDELVPLKRALGVSVDCLELALTHRSYAYENGGLPTNERLEFLGDAVLGLVVTTSLYRNHPDLAEGRLAKLRASVVNSRALADVARRLGPGGLGRYLLLGKGEEATGGRDKESILADTLEAIIGAIYLQHGMAVAERVVHRLFDPVMARAAGLGAGLDWKTSLQELTASLGLGVPDYEIHQAGPDHAKTFTAWAIVAGQRYGGAEGRTKKEAEQQAAQAAHGALLERAGASPDPGPAPTEPPTSPLPTSPLPTSPLPTSPLPTSPPPTSPPPTSPPPTSPPTEPLAPPQGGNDAGTA